MLFLMLFTCCLAILILMSVFILPPAVQGRKVHNAIFIVLEKIIQFIWIKLDLSIFFGG